MKIFSYFDIFLFIHNFFKFQINVGKATVGETDNLLQIPRVFNFYNFLRTHPLITRLRLSGTSQQQRAQLLSGFIQTDSVVEGFSSLEQVTPSERRLFFAAAHAHFQNGCPLVAIEVMRKLPKRPLLVEDDILEMTYFAKRRRKSLSHIEQSTGTLKDRNIMNGEWNAGINGSSSPDSSSIVSSHKASDLFTPSSNSQTAQSFNWGAPSTTFGSTNTSGSMDWGTPISRVTFKDTSDELDLKDLGFGDSEDDSEGAGSDVDGEETKESKDSENASSQDSKETNAIDIMAQQYKFIACLKVRLIL